MICFIWLLSSILTSPILIMAKSMETVYIDGSQVFNCILETDGYWSKVYVFGSMFAFFCLPLLVLMLVYWLIGRRLIRENLIPATDHQDHMNHHNHNHAHHHAASTIHQQQNVTSSSCCVNDTKFLNSIKFTSLILRQHHKTASCLDAAAWKTRATATATATTTTTTPRQGRAATAASYGQGAIQTLRKKTCLLVKSSSSLLSLRSRHNTNKPTTTTTTITDSKTKSQVALNRAKNNNNSHDNNTANNMSSLINGTKLQKSHAFGGEADSGLDYSRPEEALLHNDNADQRSRATSGEDLSPGRGGEGGGEGERDERERRQGINHTANQCDHKQQHLEIESESESESEHPQLATNTTGAHDPLGSKREAANGINNKKKEADPGEFSCLLHDERSERSIWLDETRNSKEEGGDQAAVDITRQEGEVADLMLSSPTTSITTAINTTTSRSPEPNSSSSRPESSSSSTISSSQSAVALGSCDRQHTSKLTTRSKSSSSKCHHHLDLNSGQSSQPDGKVDGELVGAKPKCIHGKMNQLLLPTLIDNDFDIIENNNQSKSLSSSLIRFDANHSSFIDQVKVSVASDEIDGYKGWDNSFPKHPFKGQFVCLKESIGEPNLADRDDEKLDSKKLITMFKLENNNNNSNPSSNSNVDHDNNELTNWQGSTDLVRVHKAREPKLSSITTRPRSHVANQPETRASFLTKFMADLSFNDNNNNNNNNNNKPSTISDTNNQTSNNNINNITPSIPNQCDNQQHKNINHKKSPQMKRNTDELDNNDELHYGDVVEQTTIDIDNDNDNNSLAEVNNWNGNAITGTGPPRHYRAGWCRATNTGGGSSCKPITWSKRLAYSKRRQCSFSSSFGSSSGSSGLSSGGEQTITNCTTAQLINLLAEPEAETETDGPGGASSSLVSSRPTSARSSSYLSRNSPRAVFHDSFRSENNNNRSIKSPIRMVCRGRPDKENRDGMAHATGALSSKQPRQGYVTSPDPQQQQQ